MKTFRFRISPGLLSLAAVVCAGTTTACADASLEPGLVVETQETAPSLRIRPEFPTTPDIAARLPDSVGQIREVIIEDWNSSFGHWNWSALRSGTRTDLMRVIPEDMTEPAAREGLAAVNWILGDGVGQGVPQELAVHLLQARRLVVEAHAALDAGYPRAALMSYLGAADKLYAISDVGMARAMVTVTQEKLEMLEDRRVSSGTEFPAGELERARHLQGGAARALEDEEYPLAIQRAFYANQVIEALGRELPMGGGPGGGTG